MTDVPLDPPMAVDPEVAAIDAAFPALEPHRVWLCSAVILLVTIANLRGVRESGRFFAVPTYAFVLLCGGLVVVGLVRWGMGDLEAQPASTAARASSTVPTCQPTNVSGSTSVGSGCPQNTSTTRSRSAAAKPSPLLTASEDGLLMRFPPHWLDDHPLTRFELEEEAQRLGRVLRPKGDGRTAHFYTIVSRDTVDADFAAHRQRFLAEQGYAYRILDAADL